MIIILARIVCFAPLGNQTREKFNEQTRRIPKGSIFQGLGKTRAGRVYTLPPEEIEEVQFIDRHSALLKAYRRQDWAAALRLLDDGLLAAARHLAPVYDLYRRRIAQFQIEAPPQNWDGVFTAEEK